VRSDEFPPFEQWTDQVKDHADEIRTPDAAKKENVEEFP